MAIVPDEKLSLAIGRDGQNARLAARLTGWKIDVLNGDGTSTEPVPAPPEEPESIPDGADPDNLPF